MKFKLLLHKGRRTIRNRSLSSETISQRLKQTYKNNDLNDLNKLKQVSLMQNKQASGRLLLGSNLSLIFNFELPGNLNGFS